jgi:hypothetical protein
VVAIDDRATWSNAVGDEYLIPAVHEKVDITSGSVDVEVDRYLSTVMSQLVQ